MSIALPNPLIITNDDGIDAPGIRALWDAVGGAGKLIAPAEAHSGCSHTITMHGAIAVDERSDTEIAVHGTPADCVRMALNHLETDPAFVLSGINMGGNLGHDIYLSGTVGAAREAALHRIPAIALSRYFSIDKGLDWDYTGELAVASIEAALANQPDDEGFWNINIPNVTRDDRAPEMVFCERCTQALPVHYKRKDGKFHYARDAYKDRPRCEATDVDVCFGGDVAITWIGL